MPRVLITGGLGFIGLECCKIFVERGWNVNVLDIREANSSERLRFEKTGVNIYQGDIRSREAVEHAIESCSYVVNLAAQVSVQESIINPDETIDVNVNGLQNVIDCALEGKILGLIHASSAAVYGNPSHLPLDENSEIRTISPYAESKAVNEAQIRDARNIGLNAMSLRFFNVYGPSQRSDSAYASVIPNFIQKMLGGEAPTIYGDGKQTRDFVHVRDVSDVVVDLIVRDIEFEFSEANVSCNYRHSVLDIVQIINENLVKTGHIAEPLTPLYTAAREGDILHSVGDNSRISLILGRTIDDRFESGISKMIEHEISCCNQI